MRCSLTAAAVAAALAMALPNPSAAARRFTVEDSIGLSIFVRPSPSAFGQYLPIPEVTVSPDGAHAVVVTMRGDAASGKREATLWLFDARSLGKQLASAGSALDQPKQWLQFSNMGNRAPIGNWRWSEDSRSLLFTGADDDGSTSLYRLGLDRHAPVLLSKPGQAVSRFDEVKGRIVYFAHDPIRGGEVYQAGGPGLPDIVDGFHRNVLDLLFPNWLDAQFEEWEQSVWAVGQGGPTEVMSAEDRKPVRLRESMLVLSPDRKTALVTRFAAGVPKAWERYQPVYQMPGAQFVADAPSSDEDQRSLFRPMEYATLDLQTGKVDLLTDTPVESMTSSIVTAQPAWSPDGSAVAVLGAYPALTGAGIGAQDPQAVYPCELSVVEPSRHESSCVRVWERVDPAKNPYAKREKLVSLKWNGPRELVASYTTPSNPNAIHVRRFRQEDGAWKAAEGPAESETPAISFQVQQDLDQSPVLAARLGSGAWRPLFDPNPQLKDIELGSVGLYTWKDSEGDAWNGALIKPPHYSAARRYPLVIQTHLLDRGKFLVDGPSATGFAARALAARDMLVLQVDEPRKYSDTSRETEAGADGYRAAVKQLAAEGLVDPDKVGIVTWSHMGPYAMQGLIDSPGLYKAATFADAAYNSYGEYLINIDYRGLEREQQSRAQYGPKPFGEGFKTWLDLSPGFHTDRVCAPLLWQVNSPPSLVYGWDAYAALRAQDKPIDMLYLRNGDHVLAKPLERMAEQGMNVDWFDYWLNGNKDPDPRKAKQYRRWDGFRQTLPQCPAEQILKVKQ